MLKLKKVKMQNQKIKRKVKKIRIGIDPGMKGAMTCVQTYNDSSVDTIVYRFERMTRPEIVEVLWHYSNHSNAHAVLEKVHSMPRQGVASTFKFGESFGFIQGVLYSCKISFDLVTPQAWMKFYSMKKSKTESSTQWKNRLKEVSQRYFPKKKITLDMADSMLIGLYCERNY